MKETVFYKSPIGAIRLVAEDDALTELFFVSTERSGVASDDDVLYNNAQSEVLKKTVQQLDDYFSGKNLSFDIPLNQSAGTPFQQKVWKELLNIRSGSTLSYLELSKRLGDVKAIRAVGTANGRNTVSIIVPCHRVIGSNGTLVGYGGDLWRKKWLLEHEARYSSGVQTLFD
ncbi:MAG: methylated-DNA--[protein]-cysteine S-methyltransferase [Ferruginibacter sp.]